MKTPKTNYSITMTRKEQREYAHAKVKTIQREQLKQTKYNHDLLCSCRRCDPGIITRWRTMSVKEMA